MEPPSFSLLLVEDEPDLRDALKDYLAVCGFLVTAVASAQQALETAAQNPPSVLLTDLSLPDRRGDAFLEEFHRNHPSCLLYIHSGTSDYVLPEHLKAIGMSQDQVFFKPTVLSVLVNRLKADLASSFS